MIRIEKDRVINVNGVYILIIEMRRHGHLGD